MPYHVHPLISESGLAEARQELGTSLPRILGYFREDGIASLSAIERAMRDRDPAAMVLPAHKLKGESRQLGGERLTELALYLEMTARRCIEERAALPDELAPHARALRPLFHETITQIERVLTAAAAAPAIPPRARPGTPGQRPVFGRRAF